MRILYVTALATLLIGCDKSSIEQPTAPAAASPTVSTTSAAAELPVANGMSAGLTARSEMPRFDIDMFNSVPAPLTRQPVQASAGTKLEVSGFGFDSVAQSPGKGLDIVIDGTPYAAQYGISREDVANYFKAPALALTGFTFSGSSALMTQGTHTLQVRVISADGASYLEGPALTFVVK